MARWRTWTIIMTCAALAAGPADADTADVEPSCTPLFGDDTVHDRNARHRVEALIELDSSDVGANVSFDLVHTEASWTAPVAVIIEGLQPVPGGTVVDAEGAALASAWIIVGSDLASVCDPGTYALHVDDSISRTIYVLAITPDGLLAEHAGRLVFVAFEGHTMPSFRMIWRSSYSLRSPPPVAVGTKRPPAKPRPGR